MSLDGGSFKVPWVLRTLVAPLILQRVLKTGRMGTGRPMPPGLAPQGGGDEQAAIQALREVLGRMQKDDATFPPHPFFGQMDPQSVRRLHLIHAAHHLSFLVPKLPSAAPSAQAGAARV
jgi:hypothetical protein